MEKINIDKEIENRKCPMASLCVVATTCMSKTEREHWCYLCWKTFCKQNNIEIDYSKE